MLVVGTATTASCRSPTSSGQPRRYGVEPLLFPGIGHDLMLDAGQDRVLDAVLNWVDALG